MKVIITAFALWLVAMPVAAQPSLTALLEKYCSGYRADPGSALRHARADGLVGPPSSLMSELAPDMPGVDVLWAVTEGEVIMVLAGRITDEEMDGDMCAVASMPQNFKEEQTFRRWLGVSEQSKEKYFLFSDGPQGPQVIKPSDSRAMAKAMRSNSLRAAAIESEPTMSMLMLMWLDL